MISWIHITHTHTHTRSPCGHKELDMTEQLTNTHTHILNRRTSSILLCLQFLKVIVLENMSYSFIHQLFIKAPVHLLMCVWPSQLHHILSLHSSTLHQIPKCHWNGMAPLWQGLNMRKPNWSDKTISSHLFYYWKCYFSFQSLIQLVCKY